MNRTAAMEAAADRVEAFFRDAAIDLTMGGEPTFVSATPEQPEWNTAAIGPEKLGYARRMTARLLEREYRGGLVMQVYGKLYPGEPLPRWTVLTLHSPEIALWPSAHRLLLDDRPGTSTIDDAGRLARELAAAVASPARLLPVAEPNAEGTTSGWVLPLDRVDGRWISDSWPHEPGEPLELLSGDSPVGLRLPLGDLPDDALRRALSVTLSDGALEIFLPPLDSEGFLALVGRLREIAEELDLSDLLFCGYPPADGASTFTLFGMASDPGVLEANLPACDSWHEYRRILSGSHAAAASEGLKPIKLHFNGAVHGTGGGAHLTFGGPSPERNPFLQDPERVSSMLRYWQHHPSLSYLFSGQYVGPGCQAPRIDEGPLHGLHELEVACRGIEALPGEVTGTIIDRHLRHLATDATGNTHRAEICFDKFGNAAAPNGYMGIIELRAFETLPDVESMAAVALFVRTILARLFRKPFREPLGRFGPRLHDRYFLPAYLWQDVKAICSDLDRCGFPFDPDWLRPAFEFRCPTVGTLETPVGDIEVRQALESWPLLAEESAGAHTVRVVDNSTDRLQIAATDPAIAAEGNVVVNGVALPFQEVDGRAVAGIRYKCASAYPALHPHIEVQSPLRLEWIGADGIVGAAADYHYWNPDGPTYTSRPATEAEAQARRRARWRQAPGRIGCRSVPVPPETSPEFQATIDLRRIAATPAGDG